MARKKKEFPLLEQIKITGVAAEGKALARVNDLVVFVPYVVPGDVVDLKIRRKKHSYADNIQHCNKRNTVHMLHLRTKAHRSRQGQHNGNH